MRESIDLNINYNRNIGSMSVYSGVSNRLGDPSTNKIKKAKNLNTDHRQNKGRGQTRDTSLTNNKRSDYHFNNEQPHKGSFDNAYENNEEIKRSTSHTRNFMLNQLSPEKNTQGMSKKTGATLIGGFQPSTKAFGSKMGSRKNPLYYEDTNDNTNHEQHYNQNNEHKIENIHQPIRDFESPLARGLGSVGSYPAENVNHQHFQHHDNEAMRGTYPMTNNTEIAVKANKIHTFFEQHVAPKSKEVSDETRDQHHYLPQNNVHTHNNVNHPLNANSAISEVNLNHFKNTDNTKSYQVMKNIIPIEQERKSHQVYNTNLMSSSNIGVHRNSLTQANFISNHHLHHNRET